MDFFLKVMLFTGMLLIHYVLSSQKNVYLGVVVPLIFVAGMSWRYLTVDTVSVKAQLMIIGIGLFCLMAEWLHGREVFQKNQEKELERLRIKDLK
ncbi:hypothetical protein [Exiguobacterium sp. S22-S28]|uniref:hypothetical protein n=1 Tax=Exiguobacterium sp. S22-S28 TaxID=3342768 RepID=UPI00372D13D2